jgi:hypothetical protein
MDFKGFAFDGVEHALAKAKGAKPSPCSLHPIALTNSVSVVAPAGVNR